MALFTLFSQVHSTEWFRQVFKRLVSFASVTEANFRSMALPVPPGDEALAALAPAPAAPEVIIFSFIYFFFPFASRVSLTEGFG